MPAEIIQPAPGQTCAQLLLELAEAVGTMEMDSEGNAALPSSSFEMKKLWRKLNAGMELMAIFKPDGWSALMPTVSLSLTTDTASPDILEGDISQYILPAGVTGQPISGWRWRQVDSNISGEAKAGDWGEVSTLLAGPTTLTWPRVVAVSNVNAADGSIVWVARVWPRPHTDIILEAEFQVTHGPLTELTQRHRFGAIHDPTVKAAAKWAWVMDDATDPRRDAWKEQFDTLLAASAAKDSENDPKELGPLSDQLPGRTYYGAQSNVAVFNGVEI